MPVLIKSMTMPKSCIHCRFSRSKRYIFAICEISDVAYLEEAEARPSDCPLTEGKEIVKGEWRGTVCSACGTSYPYEYDADYCPNCGARMEGEEDG